MEDSHTIGNWYDTTFCELGRCLQSSNYFEQNQ